MLPNVELKNVKINIKNYYTLYNLFPEFIKEIEII